MDQQRDSDVIPHQDLVEDVIDTSLEDASTQAAVTNLGAASASYVQAEASATRARVDLLTQVMRDAGLIPSA